MRLPVILISIAFLISFAVDFYLYRIIAKRNKRKLWRRLYLYSAIVFIVALIALVALPKRSGDDDILVTIMWALFGYISIYFPKILCVIVDVISLLPKLWRGRRWNIVTKSGALFAVYICLAMWWGALVNRFTIDVEEVEMEITGLPEQFEGYRVALFSDLHVGTYKSDTTFIAELVNEINSQRVDAILFTGDVVNRRSDELLPFVKTLSGLHATDGIFSILGNHDYGDYINWQSKEQKRENMELIYRLQRDMGWRLLRNEHVILHRGNDSIALIGVENWGDPPFPTYGSLDIAYPGVNDCVTKILLTHNPAHWVNLIKDNNDMNIALTLSGHTHAMQMSILGFSPAAWRYDTWGGRYDDNSGKILYVNIGIGTVAIPMRLGATPEVTVITLRRLK